MIITRTSKIGELNVTQSFEISVEEINSLKVDLDKVLESVFKDFAEKPKGTVKHDVVNPFRDILVGEPVPETIVPLKRTEERYSYRYRGVNNPKINVHLDTNNFIEDIKREVASQMFKNSPTNKEFAARYQSPNSSPKNKR